MDVALGAWSSWEHAAREAVAEQPTTAALFEVFRTAEDLPAVLGSFAALYRQAVLAPNEARSGAPEAVAACKPPWAATFRFPYEPIRVLLGGSWKAKQLWSKLDDRCSRPEYVAEPCAAGRMKGKRVVIVGAGPSGLRAAIEMRLLGARVTIVERRESFTRLNRLHLWNWCGEELKALGARCLEPPPLDFGSDPDLLHAGISEIQILLLKTALLLGVQILLGYNYKGIEWATDGTDGWVVNLETSAGAKEARLTRVAALLGAGGLACGVGGSVGLDSIDCGNLRSEGAIGLVCNFTHSSPGGAGGDRALRSFALAKQYYGKLFVQLHQEAGAELENIVYTKSKETHYFVMTPTRRCLTESKVLIDPDAKPMLASDNINREALDAFVRRVVSFHFKEGQPTLLEATAAALSKPATPEILKYADRGPQLFDFSKMHRMAEGLSFVPPPPRRGAATQMFTPKGYNLLVALLGDALLEPFWPEGLGIVRGFFGALDACHAVSLWSAGASQEVVGATFTESYGQLKSLAAATRGRVLRDNERAYALAPCTRYRAVTASEVAPLTVATEFGCN